MYLYQVLSRSRSYIMGIAMVCILLFHQKFYMENPLAYFMHLTGYWGVDLFLLCSGFGIAHSLERNSLRTYFKNRFWRLLPACILVGMIRFVLTLCGFWVSPYIDPQHLWLMPISLDYWFIYALIAYYLMAPFLQKGLRKYPEYILSAVVMLCFFVASLSISKETPYLISHLPWITARLPIFALGMLLYLYPKSVVKEIPFLLIGTLFLLGAFILRYLDFHGTNVHHAGIYLCLCVAVPALCLYLDKGKRLTDACHLTEGINWLGRYSLEIYLWHEFIFWLMLHQKTIQNVHLQFLIAILLTLLLAVITKRICNFILKIKHL